MDFPRYVHQAGGRCLAVNDQDGYDAALQDGWSPVPVAVRLQLGDEQCDVYTAESLDVALEQGWTRVDDVAVEPARKRSRK